MPPLRPKKRSHEEDFVKQDEENDHLSSSDDTIECPICMERYEQPFELPCGHVFCFICIKGQSMHDLRCVLCRAPFRRQLLSRVYMRPGGTKATRSTTTKLAHVVTSTASVQSSSTTLILSAGCDGTDTDQTKAIATLPSAVNDASITIADGRKARTRQPLPTNYISCGNLCSLLLSTPLMQEFCMLMA